MELVATGDPEQEGRDLAAWVKSHGTEPDYVYITHSPRRPPTGAAGDPGRVPEARPVALAESIPAMEEPITPGWMQIWGGFFPGQLTSLVVCGDVVYNQTHMWMMGSTPDSRAS